ncbi:MAG: DUF2231 domain-containing protein [Planctomycetota bacterium]
MDWSIAALLATVADADLASIAPRALGRLHPIVVHFPIALLIMAGATEFITALFSNRRRSNVAATCLVTGAVAAVAAAWFGWLFAANEPPGDSVATTLALHRWIGIAAAAIASAGALCLLLDLSAPRDWARNGYRAAVIAAAAVVGVSGHYGGTMVYGEDFLVSTFRPPASDWVVAPPIVAARDVPRLETDGGAPAPAPALVSFEERIQPILESHCLRCHGPRRQLGKLRLDSLADLLDTARDAPIIVPGDAAASVLFRRIALPADDPDRMPAKGDPLSPAQIDLVRAWIDAGAMIDDLPDIAAADADAAAHATDDERPAPSVNDLVIQLDEPSRQQRDQALARLAERGGVALPVAGNTDAVQVDLSRADPPVDRVDLDLLRGLESTLVWLDLSHAEITDADLASLGRFQVIQRLKLAHAPIGDAGLAHLAALGRLESLNLVGTGVTDTGLAHLSALSELRRLYVWDTTVSHSGAAALRDRLPSIEIVRGQTDVLAVAAETAPPAAPLPVCCAEARAAGGTCDHPCCVEAAAAGAVCSTCSATPAAGGT